MPPYPLLGLQLLDFSALAELRETDVAIPALIDEIAICRDKVYCNCIGPSRSHDLEGRGLVLYKPIPYPLPFLFVDAPKSPSDTRDQG